MGAGTVSVMVEPAGAGSRVTVTYDLTALTEEARPRLRRFAAEYGPFLDSSRTEIRRW